MVEHAATTPGGTVEEQGTARVGGRQAADAGRSRWLSLTVLATALGMIIMDATVVSVSLPTIVEDLDLSLDDAQWVTAAYNVVLAALLLTAGRLGDALGRRRVLAVGVVLFLVGSLMSSQAESSGALIVARLVQALGGAAVLPGTLSTVNATFRGKDRAAAFGVWGAVIAGAAAIGPLLGGWLTTSFSWPWIFLVNVPIGALVLVGLAVWVPETRAPSDLPGRDVLGPVLSALGFGMLVFGLIEGQQLGWWRPSGDGTVLGLTWPQDAPVSVVPVLFALSAVVLALFVLWERHLARRRRSALLDLGLFALPTFRWGNITAATVAVGEFGLLFVLPLYLVDVLDLSALGAGFVLAALALGAFFSGAAARLVAARIGPPRVVVVGLAIEIVGVLAVALVVGPATEPALLAALLVVYGVGLGLASAQLTGTTLLEVPPQESGQGSAAQSTVRQLGSALGTAIVGAVLAASLMSSVPARLADVPGLPPAEADQLADDTSASAGSLIARLRSEGTASPLGPDEPRVVAALDAGFADATAASLRGALVFLVLGFGGSLLVVRAARGRSQTPEDAPPPGGGTD